MNTGAYATIREHLYNVFAQGLQIVAPAELGAIAQEHSAMNLSQPAALLKQLQQQAANRSVAKKEAETLVKVMQILAQAEIQLSGLDTVELNNLTEAQHGVYLPANEVFSGEPRTLEALLTISNPFVRGQQVCAYIAQASDDELTQAVERLWCDVACAPAIAEGLRARPEQALRLAREALAYINPAIQYTALRVLRTLSPESSHAHAACVLLTETPPEARTPKIKKQFSYYLAETQAHLEGRTAAFRQETLRRRAGYSALIKNLTAPHKNVRKFAIQEIAKTNDPAFVDVIAPLLHQETESKNIKTILECLAEIGGFEAVPIIRPLLGGEFTPQAIETLSRLGDRSALTYIFTQLADKKLSEYAIKALGRYGDLVLYPFILAIEQLKKPNAHKKLFTTLWPIIGSQALQERLIAEAERFAELAKHPIMAYIVPEQAQTKDEKKLKTTTDKEDRKAQIVALATTERIRSYGAAHLFVTPDGQRIVMLVKQIRQGKIEVIRTTDWTAEYEHPITGYCHLMHLTPDGEFMLLTRTEMGERAWEYRVDVWQLGQWDQPLGTVPFPMEPSALAMTADHRAVVIGGERLLQVVACDTWQIIQNLPGHADANYQRVSYAACIPHSSQLVTGDWTGKLNVWDTSDWRLLATLKSDSWASRWADISADGKYLVYGGHIGIKIWETATWTEVAALKKPTMECVAVSPDGRLILTGKDKKLRVFDFATLKPVVALDDDDMITAITITPDGRHILTGGARKGLKVWNLDLSAL